MTSFVINLVFFVVIIVKAVESVAQGKVEETDSLSDHQFSQL